MKILATQEIRVKFTSDDYKPRWIDVDDLVEWIEEFKPRSMQIDALIDKIKTERYSAR